MLFIRKQKAYRVSVEYEYVSNQHNVGVVKRTVSDIELAKSKQHLYKKLKKKFKYSNILNLKIEELD